MFAIFPRKGHRTTAEKQVLRLARTLRNTQADVLLALRDHGLVRGVVVDVSGGRVLIQSRQSNASGLSRALWLVDACDVVRVEYEAPVEVQEQEKAPEPIKPETLVTPVKVTVPQTVRT